MLTGSLPLLVDTRDYCADCENTLTIRLEDNTGTQLFQTIAFVGGCRGDSTVVVIALAISYVQHRNQLVLAESAKFCKSV